MVCFSIEVRNRGIIYAKIYFALNRLNCFTKSRNTSQSQGEEGIFSCVITALLFCTKIFHSA